LSTHAVHPGVDPYSTAASDAYQDLFREGSFTGKGIYDLRAFEATLKGRFRENEILSHDLIEGCHGRVGLASDVEVFDGYPSRYDADANECIVGSGVIGRSARGYSVVSAPKLGWRLTR
jgi:hypothetical protein